jgi:hypothetical protein
VADFQKAWNGIIFAVDDAKASDKIVFNDPNEWRPWTSPPFGPELDRASLLAIRTDVPVIYQIVQTTPMRPNL